MKRTLLMTLAPQPRPCGIGDGVFAWCDAGYDGVGAPAVDQGTRGSVSNE